jgi:hypothetical protein
MQSHHQRNYQQHQHHGQQQQQHHYQHHQHHQHQHQHHHQGGGNSMSSALNKLQLPPGILKLFEAKPPPSFIPPITKPKMGAYSGVGEFVGFFEDETPELPPWSIPESRLRRKERIERERTAAHEQELREALKNWDPSKDENANTDPYSTLFVAKLVIIFNIDHTLYSHTHM